MTSASAVPVVDGVLASHAHLYPFWPDRNDAVTFSTPSLVGGDPALHLLHGYRRAHELALVWRTREETARYEDAMLVRRYLPATNAFTVPEFQRPAGGAPGVVITAGDAPSALPWPSPENPQPPTGGT